MSSFLGPGVNIPGGPPKLTVIKQSGTHVNDTKRTGVINSYNMRNSTFVNSYNNRSRVDNAPHDWVKPTPGDGRHPISATGPNGVNPLNNAPILRARLEETRRAAQGVPRHLPPGTVEHNINSRNIHSNNINNVLNDYSTRTNAPEQEDDGSEEGEREDDEEGDYPQRPGMPHVQSDPGTGNPPSNPTRPPMMHRGGQSAPSYPGDLTRLPQQGTPNQPLPAQHAASSSGNGLRVVNGVLVQVEEVNKRNFYTHEQGDIITNIDSYNITGNTVLDTLNDESTVNYAPYSN